MAEMMREKPLQFLLFTKLLLKSNTTEMGVTTKNSKDDKVVRAVTCHLTCLFGLHIRQMDLENDCDYHKK